MIDQEKPIETGQERFERQPRPEKPGKEKIAIGYILCVVGGLLGCFIGWHLAFSKRTLPNGEQAPAYNETARKHGRTILFLGLGFTVLWFLYRLHLLDVI